MNIIGDVKGKDVILVEVYNGEKFLKEQIESIINQSYTVLAIDQQAKTSGGYYSKYNTQASQTFGGAVADGLLQGMSQALPEAFKTDVQTSVFLLTNIILYNKVPAKKKFL
jgi:hypothetical protein